MEYQLAQDVAVAVTYLRAKGEHLYHWQDINLSQPATASIGIARSSATLTYPQYDPLARPNPEFDRILLLRTNGSSSYHALVVQVNKRFSRGHQFASSYTLARTIDDNPTLGALNPGPGDSDLLSDSRDPSLDVGEADYSQRHRLVLSGIWSLDYASGLSRPLKAILGGWELSSIVTAESGQPYSGYVSYDLNQDGNSVTDRTPGLARNTFVRPTTCSVDTRMTKTVPMGRTRLQLSAEAFNVFNRANISGVRTTQFSRSMDRSKCDAAGTPCLLPPTGASAFGVPNDAKDPRIVQLSMRLTF